MFRVFKNIYQKCNLIFSTWTKHSGLRAQTKTQIAPWQKTRLVTSYAWPLVVVLTSQCWKKRWMKLAATRKSSLGRNLPTRSSTTTTINLLNPCPCATFVTAHVATMGTRSPRRCSVVTHAASPIIPLAWLLVPKKGRVQLKHAP